ncbi:probable ATP-dependent RNA helicase Dbp73D [Chelonus insularis]|uniref:probable ATP-dependent RNA helicase Dbp73D n=1 Tax=Chelonus insularis TaxID=460826 RepID=UPI00158E09B5|nr:probable ATP-dependent RNA helicase Dbp73D [Chelonus insularis]
MDLFVINRYNDKKESDKPHNHLSELLQKIEERKKLREQGALSEGKNFQNSEENNLLFTKSHRKSRKRKKEKINVDDGEQTDNKPEDVSINNTNDDVNAEKISMTEKSEKSINKQLENFMVLGSTNLQKKRQVKRVLPVWLARPQIISSDVSSGPKLKELKGLLDDQLIQLLKANGINKLFPVQEKLINWMQKCSEDRMKGWWVRDTCVSAPTGSGKTLAYVLPIIQYLKNQLTREIRCLIVVPVQELAAQIYKVLTTYSTQSNLKIGLISGASTLEIEQKNLIKTTERGQFISRVDILVATPGRLIDHIERTNGFSLQSLEFLVIDEADRATDWLKFIPEYHHTPPYLTIKNLNSHPIKPAQKLLFSATLSQDPEKLSRLSLFNPILFTSVSGTNQTDEDIDLDNQMNKFIGKYTSPNELIERAYESPPEYKPIVLYELIKQYQKPTDKILIFTNSGESAHRLAILLASFLEQLQINFNVSELSAQLIPKQRAQILEKFRAGESRILVSSDALARGLDIHDIKLVVSYDLPKSVKGYIHRVGRTGRAGVSGTAISILTPNQIVPFNRMLSSAHKVVPTIEHLESVESIAEKINYQSHLDKLKRTIESEQTKELEKIRLGKRRKLNNNKSNNK